MKTKKYASVEKNQSGGLLASVTSVMSLMVFSLTLVIFSLHNMSESIFSNAPWFINGNYWQVKWAALVGMFGSNKNAWIYGSYLLRFLTYWGVALPFLFVDITGRPSFIKRYKIQPGTNEPITFSKMRNMLRVVLFNHFIVLPPTLYITYLMVNWREVAPAHELPTLARFLTDMLLLIPLYEMAFYYSHRMLHHRLFYKRIHKLHHDNTAVLVLDYQHSHWFEYFITVFPHSFNAALVGTHFFTFCVFTVILYSNSMLGHAGYHLPFLPSPQMHDYHHLKFHECFGGLSFLDRFHGTDKTFRNSVYGLRHRIFFGLTPINELYPDPPQPKKSQ